MPNKVLLLGKTKLRLLKGANSATSVEFSAEEMLAGIVAHNSHNANKPVARYASSLFCLTTWPESTE